MQIEELFIWGNKEERKTGQFRYWMTITITSSVANQNAGFALVHDPLVG